MKTSLLRLSVLAALLASPLLTIAAPAPADSADRAAQLLARHGSVSVSEAGPYVNLGTPHVQVSVKLGRPSEILPDGAWLYRGYRVEDSAAEGVLVVRFTAGRVSARCR